MKTDEHNYKNSQFPIFIFSGIFHSGICPVKSIEIGISKLWAEMKKQLSKKSL